MIYCIVQAEFMWTKHNADTVVCAQIYMTLKMGEIPVSVISKCCLCQRYWHWYYLVEIGWFAFKRYKNYLTWSNGALLAILTLRRLLSRDLSWLGGSYGNNNWVIFCPAPKKQSWGCCYPNSLPNVINPKHNMTTTLYPTYKRQNKFKFSAMSIDVIDLPSFLCHTSLVYD